MGIVRQLPMKMTCSFALCFMLLRAFGDLTETQLKSQRAASVQHSSHASFNSDVRFISLRAATQVIRSAHGRQSSNGRNTESDSDVYIDQFLRTIEETLYTRSPDWWVASIRYQMCPEAHRPRAATATRNKGSDVVDVGEAMTELQVNHDGQPGIFLNGRGIGIDLRLGPNDVARAVREGEHIYLVTFSVAHRSYSVHCFSASGTLLMWTRNCRSSLHAGVFRAGSFFHHISLRVSAGVVLLFGCDESNIYLDGFDQHTGREVISECISVPN